VNVAEPWRGCCACIACYVTLSATCCKISCTLCCRQLLVKIAVVDYVAGVYTKLAQQTAGPWSQAGAGAEIQGDP